MRGLDERGQRLARLFEIPVLVAALLVIPVILIEAFSDDATLAEPRRISQTCDYRCRPLRSKPTVPSPNREPLFVEFGLAGQIESHMDFRRIQW